jgi:hypothetical protein
MVASQTVVVGGRLGGGGIAAIDSQSLIHLAVLFVGILDADLLVGGCTGAPNSKVAGKAYFCY